MELQDPPVLHSERTAQLLEEVFVSLVSLGQISIKAMILSLLLIEAP